MNQEHHFEHLYGMFVKGIAIFIYPSELSIAVSI